MAVPNQRRDVLVPGVILCKLLTGSWRYFTPRTAISAKLVRQLTQARNIQNTRYIYSIHFSRCIISWYISLIVYLLPIARNSCSFEENSNKFICEQRLKRH